MSTYILVLPSPQKKIERVEMREGPTHAEKMRQKRGREIERYPPKKSFGWLRKTTQEDEKLGD